MLVRKPSSVKFVAIIYVIPRFFMTPLYSEEYDSPVKLVPYKDPGCVWIRGVANGGAGGADCPPDTKNREGEQKSGRGKRGKGKKKEGKEEKREKGRKKREKEKRKGKRKRGRKREKGKERKREEKKGEKGRKGGEEKGGRKGINIMFHRYLNISNGMNFA